MEQIRKIVILLILSWGMIYTYGQEDLTRSDSIPTIPTYTDTLAVDTIVTTLTADTAEVESDDEETYINLLVDTLYKSPNCTTLDHFLTRLEDVMRTKSGNVHIVHIGGSHVQAGTMTNRIRKHLLEDYGQEPAERGFIFPYSAANNCNNPFDYKVTKKAPFNLIRNVYANHPFPLGGSGIAVWCADEPNWIGIQLKDNDFRYLADTLVLWGSTRGYPIDPILQYDTVYQFPDSIDSDNGHFYFYPTHPLREFTFHFPCSKGDTFIVNGIQILNANPGITVSSIGVNGAQVTSYLRCKNFERDMAFIKPDLVIFGIGVNDAFGASFDTVAFQNNYLQLVKRIRNSNPECAFIFLTNNDTWKKGRKGKYYVNPTGPAVQDAMYRLANATGGAVWDQFEVMGGLRSMETWRRKGLAQKDHVHFTAAGYNLIGDFFYDALIREIKINNNDAQ